MFNRLFLIVAAGFCASTSHATHSLAPLIYDENGCSRPLVVSKSYNYACMNAFQDDLFAALNCQIDYVEPILPARKLLMLAEGKIDLISGLSETPERQINYRFSDPIFQEEFSILGHPSTADQPVYELCDTAMQSFNLVANLELFISHEVSEMYDTKTCYQSLQPFPYSGEQLLSMIKAKRADIVLMQTSIFEKIAKEKGAQWAQDIVKHPAIIIGAQNHIALSKHSTPANLVEAVDEMLDEQWVSLFEQCIAPDH